MYGVRVLGNFQGDCIDVYVFPPGEVSGPRSDERLFRPNAQGDLELQPAGELGWNGLPAPTYRIPTDVATEIVRQQMRELLPEGATVDALTDARAVRDRLLGVVEAQSLKGVPSYVLGLVVKKR